MARESSSSLLSCRLWVADILRLRIALRPLEG
jgi:hypothetical protein